ncbi:MAG TPA: PA0069 family radical SAM protein [Steroidobacteraceae bacterium]|nr:PA0069 family radical SAM protein [Steroidobacteraceae bacterium]
MGSPIKGRGTGENREGRFESRRVSQQADGWWRDEAVRAPATEVRAEVARSIIAHNESPDLPFNQSINPYRGCEHGCIYCYARPTHAYVNLSAGLDFETKLFYKENAASLLQRELSRRNYRPAQINLGASTDPYQPIEREHRITRGILEVLLRFRHPVTIVTKSRLVLRDLDLLREMSAERLCRVMISVTTLDTDLKRALEPRAPSPAARLQAIAALAQAGVPVGVMAAPMIPALNDHELEKILRAAAAAGAQMAGYIPLRLPLDVKDLFERWLHEHLPLRAAHVLSRIRAMRGGLLNDARFGTRLRGEGAEADLLARRFAVACRRLALDGRGQTTLNTDAFRVPARAGDQLRLDGL